MAGYLAMFAISFSTLALEITLTRLLSVNTWYHLAFFAVSTAMLGMTSGATTVYLRPMWFTPERLTESLVRFCLGYALVTPLSLSIICLTPLDTKRSIMSVIAVIVVTGACAMPFYFSGVTITAMLTKSRLPVGKIYASDLIGGALGCLFVLKGLEILDAPSLILACGSIGGLAAMCFANDASSPKRRRLSAGVFLLLAVLAIVNSRTSAGLRPIVVKGAVEDLERILVERWNSFSRVVMYEGKKEWPHYWGASPLAPTNEDFFQHEMVIDGAAGTYMTEFLSPQDIDFLRFDVTNLAYYLRPTGGACIIGVGGGRDLQSAILFGHAKVKGIDVNPTFIDLLQGRFRKFAGLADHEGVTLVVDEARSYLSRTDEKYALIQMSLIDTWAATGAGAFSLSENALYTIEGWQVFLNRLTDGGIFTVSRWYNPENVGETGRVVSLAVASLLRLGVENPAKHIAMATTSRVSTLVVCRRPLSDQDVAKLRETAASLQYELVISPDEPPQNVDLKKIVAARSMEQLEASIANMPLNYSPPTDENPYFFNMLRLGNLKSVLDSKQGVLRGNLVASLTLMVLILCLLLISVATIVLPLALGSRFRGAIGENSRIHWPPALYFSLIGAGFMSLEIGLIQKLSVFLGHPVYALGILLFTIILSAGLGSFLSERLPVKAPWIFVYPLVAVFAIYAAKICLTGLMSRMMSSLIMSRITASVLILFPLGLVMGIFFPTGMRLVNKVATGETPWYWALNGIFGVLFSALAVFFSIYFGISTNFHVGAVCYAALLLCLTRMVSREAGSTSTAQ